MALIMGLLGGLPSAVLELLMMTEEDLWLIEKEAPIISSAPPSSEDDGDDESEEVVDGVNGQTTSFLSLRSSSLSSVAIMVSMVCME